MSEKIRIALKEESLNILSSLDFTCDWNNTQALTYRHHYYDVESGTADVTLETSLIPRGATILDINFINNPQKSNNFFGKNKCKIKKEEDFLDKENQNETIKDWLNNKRYADKTYPNLPLELTLDISESDPPHTHVTLGQSVSDHYSSSLTFTPNNFYIEVNYEPGIDSSKPSPKITNFILKDLFKQEADNQKASSLLKPLDGAIRGAEGGLIISAKGDSTPNFNCFYKNYSILEFSAEASTEQPDSIVLYNLTIKRENPDGSTEIIYENTANKNNIFTLPPETFIKEVFPLEFVYVDNGQVPEVRFQYIPYHFYYTAYDSNNNGTQISGTFYLIKEYSIPSISNFSVARFNVYPQTTDGNLVYQNIESVDGEFLATKLTATFQKVPSSLILKEDNNFEIKYNILNYQKSWISDNPSASKSDEEFSKWLKTTGNLELQGDDQFTFLSGEQIKSKDSSEYTYSYTYSANYNYTITVIIKDICSSVTKTYDVLPAFSYLNIELTGIAIGERQKTGTEDRPTFDINLPTYVKQEINLVDNAAIKGVIILQNGISYGEADPSTVFTGKNEKTNPSPVEGQIYFKLL